MQFLTGRVVVGLLLWDFLDRSGAFWLPSRLPPRVAVSNVVRLEATKSKGDLSWQESLELLMSPTTGMAQRQVLFQVRDLHGMELLVKAVMLCHPSPSALPGIQPPSGFTILCTVILPRQNKHANVWVNASIIVLSEGPTSPP